MQNNIQIIQNTQTLRRELPRLGIFNACYEFLLFTLILRSMAPISLEIEGIGTRSSDSVTQKQPGDFVLDGFPQLVDVSKESASPTLWRKCTATENNGKELSTTSLNDEEHLPALGWPLAGKKEKLFRLKLKRQNMKVKSMENEKTEKPVSDMDLMKEKFCKLLLGEDMSGGGKGVSSALALSNAITNLSASIFGELYRLEPFAQERKARWRKEVDWLLSVSDYIVELVPTSQSATDGSHMEVMVPKQRSDLQMNIPALRKLDAMLLEILGNFKETEFWYEDRSKGDSFQDKPSQHRQEHKWWLPTPRVPEGGLSDISRKFLQNQRDSVKQILKAVMAINAQVLSEMEIPDIYLESLPKNGKASLGDAIYRHIASENFSPEALLASLDLSTEHSVLDVKNRIEACISIWKKKMHSKDGKAASLSSWGSSTNRELLGDRAETLLLLLKQRYPGLPQSVLDMNKIQFNKDVGQSILESYSRVLESLAFNILSRIDDVLYADNLIRYPLQPPSFDRSPSCDSIRSISISDEHSSFWTPSSTPRVHRTPCGSPKIENVTLLADNTGAMSPRSMTLSEYMGWGSVHSSDNDSVSKLENSSSLNENLLCSQQDPSKSLKKLGMISPNNKRLSYLEKLESQGIVHSPAARD